MKSIVVAFDERRGIGADNDLLWLRDLPADLKHFKNLTTGHIVVMGRHTYESIGRPLPNRRNIIVSSQLNTAEGIEVVPTLAAAYDLAGDKDLFVIGGARLYQEALTSVDQLFVTEVQATFPQATVFFPDISREWREVDREHHDADDDNKYSFDFVRYERT